MLLLFDNCSLSFPVYGVDLFPLLSGSCSAEETEAGMRGEKTATHSE